ncbi:DSBA-like thioredoxin domain protein [compost metagenome]
MSKACGTESVKRALIEATDQAAELGVIGVPSLVVGEEVFWGDDRVEEAVAAAS